MSTAPNLTLLEGFLPRFKIGATVKLKSGGPDMTVTSTQGDYVEVQWFEGTSSKQKILHVATLIKSRNPNA